MCTERVRTALAAPNSLLRKLIQASHSYGPAGGSPPCAIAGGEGLHLLNEMAGNAKGRKTKEILQTERSSLCEETPPSDEKVCTCGAARREGTMGARRYGAGGGDGCDGAIGCRLQPLARASAVAGSAAAPSGRRACGRGMK